MLIYCIFFNKNLCFSTTCLQSFLSLAGCMQFSAHGLKFCGTLARVACVILAHSASRVAFHGYF